MSKFNRKSIIGKVSALAVAMTIAFSFGAGHALAYDENSKAAINIDESGVAMRGYDPVSYFDGQPKTGAKEFSATHNGATYYFATAEHRTAFAGDPEKYAPAFGGFCAMGVALNKKLDGDPMVWRVVDGKLYLNVGVPAQKRWLQDVPGNITQANAVWPDIKEKAPKEL